VLSATRAEKGDVMNTYKARFYGRKRNAIGIFYFINAIVQGKDEKDALLNLYDNYEHIQNPTFTIINKGSNEEMERGKQ
jgi:hypothetical protein